VTEMERLVGAERTAPADLLRQLRQYDADAELIYMGDGCWWLGRYAPNRAMVKSGERWLTAVHNRVKHRQPTAEERRTYRMAKLKTYGFQFTAEYHLTDPDGRIVKDVEVMEFLWRHTSANEHDRLEDAPKEKEREEALATLQDEGRHTDAWKYAFNLSHAVTAVKPSQYRSGRTTIARTS
jgi:hypothetical protein